jgi:translocation and assembly module TamB
MFAVSLRPEDMRRKLLLATGVAAMVVSASVISLVLYVDSPRFGLRLRTEIISILEKRYPVRVRLDRVELDLWHTRCELHGLRLFSLETPQQAAVDIPRLVVDFSVTGFLRPGASLDSVQLESMRIRILEESDGGLNLANMFFPAKRRRTGPPFGITRLAIKNLGVRHGLLILRDRPISVETSQGGLEIGWRFIREGEPRYAGAANLRTLDVEISGFRMTDLTGRVDFALLDNELRLPAVSLRSDEVAVRARGTLSDLRGRAYDFETNVSVNVPLISQPNLGEYFAEGAVDFSGRFTGRGSKFRWTGDASSPLVRFQGFPFRRFKASLRLTPDGCSVDSAQAHLYGGPVSAAGQLKWSGAEVSDFTVEGQGVEVGPLLARLGQPGLPVRGVSRFAAHVQWPGTAWRKLAGEGLAQYKGQLYEPAPSSPYLPTVEFSGSCGLLLSIRQIGLRDGVAQLPHTSIDYEGVVKVDGGYAWRVEADSSLGNELIETACLLGIVRQRVLREYRVEGRSSSRIQADITKAQGVWLVSGQLTANEVYLNGRRLGRLRTKGVVTPSLLQLEDTLLSGTDFHLQGRLRLPLEPASQERTMLDATLHRVPIERFLPLLNWTAPVSGRLSGSVEAEEQAPAKYRGRGRLLLVEGRLFDEEVPRLQADLLFGEERLQLPLVRGSFLGGAVSGTASFDLGLRTVEFRLEARRLAADASQFLRRHTEVRGQVDVDMTGRGELSLPDLHADIRSQRLQVRDLVITDLAAKADVRNRQLQFELQNRVQGHPFELTGQADLHAPYPLQATIRMRQLPLAPFLSLVATMPPNLGGVADGVIELRGPLLTPEQFQIDVRLGLLKMAVQNLEVSNLTPLTATYSDRVLRLAPTAFAGPQTEVAVTGSMGFRPPASVQLKVDGRLNLQLLNGFMSQGGMSGQLQVSTSISGPVEHPRLVGAAELNDVVLSHPDLPTAVTEAHGRLKFTANQVAIDRFVARTKFGEVSVEGGVFLEGLKPSRWQVNVSGTGLRLEYPQDMVSVLDADVDVVKSERSQLISGAVYLRSSEFTKTISLAELILGFAGGGKPGIAAAGPGPASVLNLDVEAYRSIRISNNLADIVASGAFSVRGTQEHPVIMGSLTANEGRLFLENNTYEIVRGTVTFNIPRRTQPMLSLEASTEVADHTITVNVRGPLEQMNLSFRSDPPLPTSSIISLLALGQTGEEIVVGGGRRRETGALALYGAGAVLSKSLGEVVEARASRLFGFDKFSIDPFFAGGGRDPGARITLGKKLTESLTVTYSTDLSNTQKGEIVNLEYRLTKWLTAIATREQDGSLAVDFKFKKRF